MKRIIFIDQYNQSGGGQTILANLIHFALEDGFEVMVWIPQGEYFQNLFKGDPRIKFLEIKSPTLKLSRKSLFNHIYWIYYSFSFLRHISGLKGVDYVYVNGPRLSLPAIILSLFHRAKYYYHLHLLHTPLENVIFKLARKLPRTTYLFFGSDLILERFEKNKFHPKSVVFNGFLSPRFSALPYVPRFLKSNTDFEIRLNFMLLARVYEGKGHHFFLKLAADYPRHKFFVIGKAVDQHFYTKLISQATKNVLFTYADDVPALIEELGIHISIMPSTVEESFGLSSIESMAMSCLTIVSDAGNLPYQAKKTGSWVFSDYDQLKKMITQIESLNPDQLNKISQDQYHATKMNYSYENAKELFRKIIQ